MAISDKEITKLQLQISKTIYKYQIRTNTAYSSTVLYASYASQGYDEHDIDQVINALSVNNLISIEPDKQENTFRLTDNGITYVQEHSNKFVKYLKNNHLAIIDLFLSAIAIVISIIALTNSIS